MKELNDRQRIYLAALYDCDQAKEQERRLWAARGFYDRVAASEWRWVMYGPVAPPSALYSALDGHIDQGTGATWQALEDRGLCRCRTTPDAFDVPLLEVQITPAGRKLMRAARGETRPKAAPKGQLKERQWAALARLYTAGEHGIDNDTLLYAKGGFDWHATIRRLVDYRPPLVEYVPVYQPSLRGLYRITADGRAYYEGEHARYCALYPNVDAPQPAKETI